MKDSLREASIGTKIVIHTNGHPFTRTAGPHPVTSPACRWSLSNPCVAASSHRHRGCQASSTTFAVFTTAPTNMASPQSPCWYCPSSEQWNLHPRTSTRQLTQKSPLSLLTSVRQLRHTWLSKYLGPFSVPIVHRWHSMDRCNTSNTSMSILCLISSGLPTAASSSGNSSETRSLAFRSRQCNNFHLAIDVQCCSCCFDPKHSGHFQRFVHLSRASS